MSGLSRRAHHIINITWGVGSMSLCVRNSIVFAAMLLLVSGSALGKEYPKTDSDFRKLPKYCRAKLQPNSSKAGDLKYWNTRLPGIFPHIHHFCAAIHSYQHASNMFPSNKSGKQKQKHFLERVLGNITYLESHIENKNHRIFAEMYYLKAKAMAELTQTSSAIVYFEKAISVNEKYIKAYLSLAKVYIKLEQDEKARVVVERGLAVKPKSKSLRRLKNEL